MNIFGFLIKSKRKEILKTDEVRRKTREEVSITKDELDTRFAHFSDLLNGTLRELNQPLRLPKPITAPQAPSSKSMNKRQK